MIVSSVVELTEGRAVAEIGPGNTVREACRVMCEHDVGAVLVIDDGRLMGVLSERDVIRKVNCADRHSADTRVEEIMTPSPKTIDTEGQLTEALEIMSHGGFHHVPVMRGERAVGLLSADDIPDEYRMLLERFKAMRGS